MRLVAGFLVGVGFMVAGQAQAVQAAWRDCLGDDPVQAVEGCRRVLALGTAVSAQEAAAQHRLGVALGRLGRFDEAVGALNRALVLSPRDVGSWFNRGMAHALAGRQVQGLADFDRALAIDPRHLATRIHRGHLLRQRGAHERALQDYDAALAQVPGEVTILYARA